MRGEYITTVDVLVYQHGSPPHAWGIRHRHGRGETAYRFTPTCVGNTITVPGTVGDQPVHPHMRGEYASSLIPTQNNTGSPPHAWGILIAPTVIVALERFTPTCVGNTELLFSPKGDCT